MRVFHQDEVAKASNGTVNETRIRRSRLSFSPGQIVGGLVGVITTLIGVIAVTRSGVDGTLNVPVVRVLGLNQSAMVGIAEVVLGLLLVAGAASAWDRALMGFVGGVMFISGIVIAAASIRLLGDLGTDHTTGWTMLIGGTVAMAGALMPTLVTDTARREES